MTTSAAITFSPMLGQISGSDSSFSYSDFCLTIFSILFHLIFAVFFIVAWVGIIFGSIYLIHFFFTLPVRRAERARLFLDLLEGALKRGQSIEEMILSIAQSRDQTVGVRFHILAAHIEAGLRFGDALDKVPGFLPPQITAMLRAGEKLGDLKKVLPACREILRDRPAAVRSAMNYLILVVLLFSPIFGSALALTIIFVIPRFKEVAAGMGFQVWPLTLFVFANTNWLIAFEIIISFLMVVAVLLYIGGPGFVSWFRFHDFPFVDWIAWKIPWKQKRLQRTFSAMLAVLLDGGVPEAEAIRLAGDSTANEICRHRARRVIAALEKGVKLEDAVRAFDDTGEFHWRLTNATHAHGGFLNALRGWHEALDAKAFQQEEASAHAVTTGIVILNGVVVGLIVTAMFGMLVMILKGVLASD
jgi:type IV pilus assembly protein PilC